MAPAGLNASFVEPVTSVAPVDGPEEVLSASEVRRAIRTRNKIRLVYRDTKGRDTERVIWPILIGYRDAGRIIAAWCELREGFRYFRTERIVQASVLNDKIPHRMDMLRRDWRDAMDAERERYAAEARRTS